MKLNTASIMMRKLSGNRPVSKHNNQADQRSVVVYAYVVQKLTEFFVKNKLKAHTLNYEFPICSWETPFYQAELYRKLRVHCRSKHEHLDSIVFVFSIDTDITPENYEEMLAKLEELYCSEIPRFVDVTMNKSNLPTTYRMVKDLMPGVLSYFDDTLLFTAEWKLEADCGIPFINMCLYNVIDHELIQQFSFNIGKILNHPDPDGYIEATQETIANEIFEALRDTPISIYAVETIEGFLGDKVNLVQQKEGK